MRFVYTTYVNRYLLIPLFLALIVTQGFNRSASVCLDQLGHCLDASASSHVDHCPCDETESEAETENTCSEECSVCHLDHSDELFVFSGSSSVERENSAPLYTPHVLELLEPVLRRQAVCVSARSQVPPRLSILSVAKIYSVRLL